MSREVPVGSRTATAPANPAEDASASHGQGNDPTTPVSKWEWVVAAVGFALVAGTVGYMAYYALAVKAVVPEVSVERISTHATQGGYVVRFRARNRATATAASLQIEGELLQGSSVVETSTATLDFLPSSSERRGGLFFREDPNRYELRLFPKGYAEP